MDLKACRKAGGLKAAEVARLMGCSRQRVSRIETGRTTLASAQAYLAAFGWQLVAVPVDLVPEVERFAANGGVFGPTNFSGAMDDLLDADTPAEPEQ